jgi:uncharacterized protein involved in exopolysaccharide biosynthesis
MKKKPYQYEEDIQLIDIIAVMWKWKYLIVTGTILGLLVASFVTLNVPKMYMVSMLLQPEVVKIYASGKKEYIDLPHNVKALVQTNGFESEILNYLRVGKIGNIPKELRFNVTLPKKSEILAISYETTDPKQGIVIQRQLVQLLMDRYSQVVQDYQRKYEGKVEERYSERKEIVETKQYVIEKFKEIEKRIKEIKMEIRLLKKNTRDLMKKRDGAVSRIKTEGDILSLLRYRAIIQKNVAATNDLQDQLNRLVIDRGELLLEAVDLEKEIEVHGQEIDELRKRINSLRGVHILEYPTISPYAIRPKKKQNLAVGVLSGLFSMLILSFCLEHISKWKNLRRR